MLLGEAEVTRGLRKLDRFLDLARARGKQASEGAGAGGGARGGDCGRRGGDYDDEVRELLPGPR